MTPAQRINELQKRQVWYGSSMVVKLNAVNGLFYYKVLAWLDQGKEDSKITVIDSTKYNGEDPEDLIEAGLFELLLHKIKLGKPISKVGVLQT